MIDFISALDKCKDLDLPIDLKIAIMAGKNKIMKKYNIGEDDLYGN